MRKSFWTLLLAPSSDRTTQSPFWKACRCMFVLPRSQNRVRHACARLVCCENIRAHPASDWSVMRIYPLIIFLARHNTILH
eukprot:439249-Prorocentrum_minimum.AAC.1